MDHESGFRMTVHKYFLANGLTVLCLPKKSAPVVSVQVWYKAGSACEPQGVRGVAHFLEHMMFRGSPQIQPEEHSRRINDVGGHCNAFTGEDVTAYLNSVPADYLDMVLDLEAQRMAGLTLDQTILETERKVIIEEYHTHFNNPLAKAFLEFRRAFFGDHPYALSPLGTLDGISHIGSEDCRSFHARWYRPSNAVLVIVGDVESPSAVVDKVERIFGSLPASLSDNTNNTVVPSEPPAPTGFSVMKRTVEFDVPMIIAGFPAPPASSRDALALDMLHLVLSQGESSVIHRSIVREKSLAVMAGGMNQFMRHAGMSMFFAAHTPDVSPASLEKALCAAVQSVFDSGISEDDMEKIRNTVMTSRAFEMYSVENLCQHLGHAETMEGDCHAWVERLEQLQTIRRDEIIAVGKKWWNQSNRRSLYLKPRRVRILLLLMGIARRFMPRKGR